MMRWRGVLAWGSGEVGVDPIKGRKNRGGAWAGSQLLAKAEVYHSMTPGGGK
jgi:hypothetical protein